MENEQQQAASIISGLRWTSAGLLICRFMNVIRMVVLAHLLLPHDFGLLGMATVITGFLSIFRHFGTHAVVVQKSNVSSQLLNSLFFVNLVLGFSFTVVLALCGPMFIFVYNTPQVGPVIQILGAIFLISAFGIVPRALLTRSMRFDTLIKIEVLTSLFQMVTVIFLAYIGWKVWALVATELTGGAFYSILVYWLSKWRIKCEFCWSEVRTVMNFAFGLTASGVVKYINENADRFIIGSFLGATSLGYYSIAFRMLTIPLESISAVVNRVLFPAFSLVQGDNFKLQKYFLRAASGITMLMFPTMIGLFVLAPPLVLGVLGEKWRPIIPLVMAFSFLGILRAVARITGNIYLAKGRSDLLLRYQLVAGMFIVGSLFCGLFWWGLLGIAIAYCIISVPLVYYYIFLAFRLINLRFVELLTALRPYAAASLIMAGFIFGSRLFLEGRGVRPLWVLSICVFIGIFVYASTILFLRPPAFADVLKMVPGKFRWLERWLNISV